MTGLAGRAPRVVLIAAVAANGVIGRDNDLPWHIPEDLQFFRRTTLGHPVLMGRRNWDSLPPRFRPLPGRRNLVLSRDAQWQAEGAERCANLDDALARVAGAPSLFVVGGAEVYRLALPRADELVLTELDRAFDGDVVFPEWDRAGFEAAAREVHPPGSGGTPGYCRTVYRRRG